MGAEGGAADSAPLDASEWWVLLVRENPEVLILYLAALLAVWWVLAAIPFLPFKGIDYKLNAFTRGWIHFFSAKILKTEGKVKKDEKPVPAQLTNLQNLEEKEFYFIRHGESEWNEIFNRGKVLLLPRLIWALIKEMLLYPFAQKSLFLDSPLCHTGKKQAKELRANLDSDNPQQREKLKVLRYKTTKDENGRDVDSVIFCSNLKRCIETVIIGLEPRLRDPGNNETIKLFSCLQECAPNIDTLALSERDRVPPTCAPKDLAKSVKDGGRVDPQFNLGTKRWHESSISRMDTFLKFAFAQKEKRIIVSGHSFYFRELFKRYMDESEAVSQPLGHDSYAMLARKLKIRNGGVVRVVIQKGTAGTPTVKQFRIKPESIEVIAPYPEPTEKKLKGFVK